MTHLLRQVSGKKKTSRGLLLLWHVLYLPLSGAITLTGESRVVGHNDTRDVAILLQPQQWPDHNETATLYLGPVLHNRAFPAVASHEQEKPKSTKVQGFRNSSSWPLPLPLGCDQFVVHLLMGEMLRVKKSFWWVGSGGFNTESRWW